MVPVHVAGQAAEGLPHQGGLPQNPRVGHQSSGRQDCPRFLQVHCLLLKIRAGVFCLFFCGVLRGGWGGPPVLQQPARHCPHPGRGWLDHLYALRPPHIASTGCIQGRMTACFIVSWKNWRSNCDLGI